MVCALRSDHSKSIADQLSIYYDPGSTLEMAVHLHIANYSYQVSKGVHLDDPIPHLYRKIEKKVHKSQN